MVVVVGVGVVVVVEGWGGGGVKGSNIAALTAGVSWGILLTPQTVLEFHHLKQIATTTLQYDRPSFLQGVPKKMRLLVCLISRQPSVRFSKKNSPEN